MSRSRNRGDFKALKASMFCDITMNSLNRKICELCQKRYRRAALNSNGYKYHSARQQWKTWKASEIKLYFVRSLATKIKQAELIEFS